MKKRTKIRLRAGKTILAKSLAVYTTFGLLGMVRVAGLENTIKDINSKSYLYALEYENDTLIKATSKITFAIQVDAKDKKNLLNILDNCPILKCIEIHNANFLTDDVIEKINEKDINKVTLIFDTNSVLKDVANNKKFDLNKFKDKNVIKSVKLDRQDNEEFNSVVLLNYLSNYEDTELDILKYKYLDEIIDDLLSEVSLDEYNPDNVLNVIKLVNEERSYLKYDPYILKAEEEGVDLYKDKEIFKTLKRYNLESLSIILDPNKAQIADHTRQIKCICANYSDLFTFLCIKSGIECYPFDGLHVDEEHSSNHGWNAVKIGDEYYYVDVTRFDSFETLNNLMDRFFENFTEDDYELLCANIFMTIDSEIGKEYYPNQSIFMIKRNEVIKADLDCVYGTTEKKVFKFYATFVLNLYLLYGIIGALISNYLDQKKKKENKNSRQH